MRETINSLRQDFLEGNPELCKPSILRHIPQGWVFDIGFGEGGSFAFFNSAENPLESVDADFNWKQRLWCGIDSGKEEKLKETFEKTFIALEPTCKFQAFDACEPKDFPQPIALVLLIKVVHFCTLKEATEMINKAAKFLDQGGLLYVKVYSVEHKKGLDQWVSTSKDNPNAVREVGLTAEAGRTFLYRNKSGFKYAHMRFFAEGELTEILRQSGLTEIKESAFSAEEVDSKTGEKITSEFFCAKGKKP